MDIACLPILMAKIMQYGDETLRNSFIIHCLFTFALSLSIQQLPKGKPSYPHPFYHRIPCVVHASSVGCHRGSSSRTGWYVSSNAHDVYRSPKRLDVSPLLTLNHRMVWGTTEGQADALEMGWGWDVGCFCVFVCVLFGRSFWMVKTTQFSSFDTSSVLHYHWFLLEDSIWYRFRCFPTVDGRNLANHLGCRKTCRSWDKLLTSTG